MKLKQIIIIWILGHIGIVGNEIADKYAKLAASNPDITKLEISPYDVIKKAVNTQIRKKWHILWNNQDTKLN
jgi:ribonuclease HI